MDHDMKNLLSQVVKHRLKDTWLTLLKELNEVPNLTFDQFYNLLIYSAAPNPWFLHAIMKAWPHHAAVLTLIHIKNLRFQGMIKCSDMDSMTLFLEFLIALPDKYLLHLIPEIELKKRCEKWDKEFSTVFQVQFSEERKELARQLDLHKNGETQLFNSTDILNDLWDKVYNHNEYHCQVDLNYPVLLCTLLRWPSMADIKPRDSFVFDNVVDNLVRSRNPKRSEAFKVFLESPKMVEYRAEYSKKIWREFFVKKMNDWCSSLLKRKEEEMCKVLIESGWYIPLRIDPKWTISDEMKKIIEVARKSYPSTVSIQRKVAKEKRKDRVFSTQRKAAEKKRKTDVSSEEKNSEEEENSED